MAMCLKMSSVCTQFAANCRALHSSTGLSKIVQYKLSDIGQGIRDVAVKNWLVKVDDTVSQFDVICEVESDKAPVTITSGIGGKIRKLYYGVGEVASVGLPLVDIDVEDEEQSQFRATTESYRDDKESDAVQACAGTADKGITIEPINAVHMYMLKASTESLKIPTFVHSDEVNITQLSQLRQEVKSFAEKKGCKLSFLPFILKAVSKGLLEYPILNSSLDKTLDNIIYKHSHNIGVAVDSPSGLLLPNIKDVQNLTILEIVKEISRLQELASKGKLIPSEINGGTFAVTNVGSIGGTLTNILIHAPEVCTIGLGKIQTVPRFDAQGNVVPATLLSVGTAADHRITDGATVARFTNLWKYYIENPTALILDL